MIDKSEVPEKRGLVGIRYNDNAIVAWNLTDNKDIHVAAKKLGKELWSFTGRVFGDIRIAGHVFGGKYATMKFVQFIRNGLTARVKRRKHCAAKKEGEAATA